MSPDAATVLIVDDDPQVVEIYQELLDDRYQVRTAMGGREALDLIDESVDVVLLDRRMPELSGDSVLDRIREQGYDCGVVMVTGVDPDFDVITMPFNEYLTKPVTSDQLITAIERVQALSIRDLQVQEFFALVAKRHTLENEKTREELDENSEYARLTARIEDLRDRVEPVIEPFEEELAEQLAQTRTETPADDDWMQALFSETTS